MLNIILGKVTELQHASVYNKVTRVKNLEGGSYAPTTYMYGLRLRLRHPSPRLWNQDGNG